jgi:hypothetical protein
MNAEAPCMLVLHSLLAWLLLLVLAVLNGALREAVLLPALGLPFALVASGLLLCACVLAMCFALVPRLVARGARPLALGASWLALTLVFEFAFGRFVQHRSWQELAAAYTFREGNLWPLVLLVILVAPALAARSRQARGAGRVR